MVHTTRKQREALSKLYSRDTSDHASYLSFRRSLRFSVPAGDYVSVEWCGMYVGIELDGHTHT